MFSLSFISLIGLGGGGVVSGNGALVAYGMLPNPYPGFGLVRLIAESVL